jgi:RNA recognition motif-containing protein
LGGRYVDVKEAKGVQHSKPGIPSPQCLTIFVKNLPYELTADQIGDSFRPCGKISNVRMVYNTVTEQFKGFAYIDFEEHQSVLKAL